MDRKRLSAAKAGERTPFTAADFSRVRNADLGRFTIDRLIKMLMALDPRQGARVAITRARSNAKRGNGAGVAASAAEETSGYMLQISDRGGKILAPGTRNVYFGGCFEAGGAYGDTKQRISQPISLDGFLASGHTRARATRR